jgi:endonuclease/exonuclease/phosphatase family metal-dependent hydrolase
MAVTSLKVASYNVHRCIGTDRIHDPLRTARVILELGADVVGLQEVSARLRGKGAIDQAEYLRAKTGMDVLPGPCLIHRTGHYGNALLTRWPVEGVRRHDLSVEGREPRGAIEATLNVSGKIVRCIVTHLGLRLAERTAQARALSRALLSKNAAPVIVLGDCNSWVPGERSLRTLDRSFGRSHGQRSFPSYFPVFALDRIWVQPPNRMEKVLVHRSALARRASDHLPLKARITLARS